jgi:hypothetical protein
VISGVGDVPNKACFAAVPDREISPVWVGPLVSSSPRPDLAKAGIASLRICSCSRLLRTEFAVWGMSP